MNDGSMNCPCFTAQITQTGLIYPGNYSSCGRNLRFLLWALYIVKTHRLKCYGCQSSLTTEENSSLIRVIVIVTVIETGHRKLAYHGSICQIIKTSNLRQTKMLCIMITYLFSWKWDLILLVLACWLFYWYQFERFCLTYLVYCCELFSAQ